MTKGKETAPDQAIDAWWEVNVEEARAMVSQAIKVGFRRTIMLWGQRGLGKSSLVAQASNENSAHLVDKRLSQMDPSDIRGVMMGSLDPKSTVARWLLNPDFFPDTKGKRLALLLDEFTHAPDMIQKAAYEVAWDHSIGGVKLPEGTVVILASNRESENAGINSLDLPMQRRAIHLYVKFDAQVFLDYATLKSAFHPLVLSYLKDHPSKINVPRKEVDAEWLGEPLPASWEVVSDIIRSFPWDMAQKMVTGAVGPGATSDFVAWSETAGTLTPLIDRVCAGADETAQEMSMQFFVCTSLVERLRMDAKLATRILDYSIAIKDQFAETGGVMLLQAVRANRDALKNSSSWRDTIRFYKNILA